MNFNYEITALEYSFVTCFLVLYLLYIGRTIWVAQALNSTARAVVVKFFLRTFYCGLLVVSLLGPFFGESEGEIVAQGRDIFVMMDVSKSMDAADVSPSRLEKAKFELQRLVDEALGEHPDAVVFAGQLAFLRESTWTRLLHNYVVFALQRIYCRRGVPFVVVPVGVG